MEKNKLGRYALWLASFDRWCQKNEIDRKTGVLVLDLTTKADDEGSSLLKWAEFWELFEYLKKEEQPSEDAKATWKTGTQLKVILPIAKGRGDKRELKVGEIVEFICYAASNKKALIEYTMDDTGVTPQSWVPTEALELEEMPIKSNDINDL
jgi:hypothetical protein